MLINLSSSVSFIQKVRGIETIATYDSKAREFIINTPCESAQKYWIGGAANVRKHFTCLSFCIYGVHLVISY